MPSRVHVGQLCDLGSARFGTYNKPSPRSAADEHARGPQPERRHPRGAPPAPGPRARNAAAAGVREVPRSASRAALRALSTSTCARGGLRGAEFNGAPLTPQALIALRSIVGVSLMTAISA